MRAPVAPALVLALALAACSRRESPVQPIEFSHAVHAGKHAIACTDCHAGAESRARAGLPAFQTCLRCHMRPQGSPPSAREAEVRALAASGRPKNWVQVTRNPGHVYFSHRAHGVLGKMTCKDCHGEVETWAEPPRAPSPELVSMDACMSCHRQRGASNECQTCHQ